MKTFTSLLVAIAAIGAVHGSPLEERATPYQPSGCAYTITTGGSSCGGKGTLKKPSKLGGLRTVPTANGCTDLCFSMSTCKSYSYTPSTKTCQLYSKPLSQQGFTPAKKGTALYYNRNCFTQQCTCGNAGLAYAVYDDTTSDQSSYAAYKASWDPVALTGAGVEDDGSAFSLSIGYDGLPAGQSGHASSITIYNETYTPYDGSFYFAVSHTFYIRPAYNGTYALLVYNIDDIVDVWMGSKAVSGWSRDNADLEVIQPNNNQVFYYTAVAGEYVPVRVAYGQQIGPWYLRIHIADPADNDILDFGGSDPNQIQLYSCDGTTAPPFS